MGLWLSVDIGGRAKTRTKRKIVFYVARTICSHGHAGLGCVWSAMIRRMHHNKENIPCRGDLNNYPLLTFVIQSLLTSNIASRFYSRWLMADAARADMVANRSKLSIGPAVFSELLQKE